MSIASELGRLQQAKADLETSIEAKGVNVPAGTLLDAYPALVDTISGSSVLTGDAAVTDVLASKTFYNNDPTTKETGTMVDRGTVSTDISAVATEVTIAAGKHSGSGVVKIHADEQAKIITGNIKSGITILGVSGAANVVDTTSGDAIAADILATKKAWVDGAEVTGTCTYYGDLKNTIERGEDFTSLTIPDGVTSIGFYAFGGCTSLASITIPDSVTSIADEAFYGCSSLTSITIPGSITSIGGEAFRSAYLVNVTIGSTGHAVSGINEYAFYEDSGTGTLTVYTADGNALANSPYNWTGTVVHTMA